MGSNTCQIAVRLLALSMVCVPLHSAWGALSLDDVRREINTIERDLLETKEKQVSAASQLKKIKKLLMLQRKEVELSQGKVHELEEGLDDLSKQKQALIAKVQKQKNSVRQGLRELDRLMESEALDASWIKNMDTMNQKEYFLTKTLKKNSQSVESLKNDVQAALSLELRIMEEKGKLDYYVQELKEQSVFLSANEQVQKEVLRTNRVSRLEALRKVRQLKDSEKELERFLTGAEKETVPVDHSQVLTPSLSVMKGKLPFPVNGAVVSTFGRSYNSKTNLLTFQKGITISAPGASEVRAIFPGKVVFSGPLKNYGLIVILEHPGQYYSLYGQLGRVLVSDALQVKQGDAVGTMVGEPLYFEIRNKNVAINPLQWLSNAAVAMSVNFNKSSQ